MPWKGRPSFLRWFQGRYCKFISCFNALKGASFISTRKICWIRIVYLLFQCPEWGDLHFYLASENPCKSRLCGSIFLEFFQNILKKAFLKGVFWKFTICSYLTVPFLLLVYLFFLGLRSTYSTLLIDSIKKSWVMISSHHLRYRMCV